MSCTASPSHPWTQGLAAALAELEGLVQRSGRHGHRCSDHFGGTGWGRVNLHRRRHRGDQGAVLPERSRRERAGAVAQCHWGNLQLDPRVPPLLAWHQQQRHRRCADLRQQLFHRPGDRQCRDHVDWHSRGWTSTTRPRVSSVLRCWPGFVAPTTLTGSAALHLARCAGAAGRDSVVQKSGNDTAYYGLAGAVFQVLSGSTVVATLTTDAAGASPDSAQLPVGTYTVHEPPHRPGTAWRRIRRCPSSPTEHRCRFHRGQRRSGHPFDLSIRKVDAQS